MNKQNQDIYTYTLKNGIRIIHKRCTGDVSCCGFVVNAGTRNELENENGLAHFTEHMLFKGTLKRDARDILNRMEEVGGDLDAYTTKEEIFVYSFFLSKDYKRAIELISDIFFNSIFPDEEISREREVIEDEIDSYEDSPSDLIFDDFDKLIFPGHPIGRRILGNPDSIKNYNSDSFSSFYKRNFGADKIVFFSQSALPFEKILDFAEKYLGEISIPGSVDNISPGIPKAVAGVKKIIEKNTHQSHVIYGNKGYSLYDEDRLGLYLLSNILGGPGMNSRLNIALREKSGLVYSVESSATSFTDTGMFSIYFGTDPEQTERCMRIVNRELRKLYEKPLSFKQLEAAKKQLYGQVMIASENKENSTLSMGKSMLYYGRYDSIDEIMQKIDKFTPEKLMEIAAKVFNPDNMSLLIYK